MKHLMLRIILLFVAFSARGNAEDVYKQGLLVCETNAVAAYELFIKAVGGGSVEAMVASGYCCEEGMGVAENRSLAFRWYGMAVEKDAVKASRGLAAICSVRRGIRGNDLEARKTYFSKHGSDPATVKEGDTVQKILVLGAGMVAGPLIRYLLDHGYDLTVTSLVLEDAVKLIGDDPPGRALTLDLSDDTSL